MRRGTSLKKKFLAQIYFCSSLKDEFGVEEKMLTQFSWYTISAV